jgi:hypothetical protein
MQSVDMITGQDVRLAFTERGCHDGTSLAAFLFPDLFPGDARGGIRRRRHLRQAAENALRAMERRGLLKRDWLGWWRVA